MGRKQLRRIESEAERALQEIGLRFPGSPTRDHARGTELSRQLEEVRAAWLGGDGSIWPDTSWPAAPLSIPELFAYCATVDFALRRATDGVRPSRPIAVDALRLSERLETMDRSLRAHLVRVTTSKWRKAAADIAMLRFHLCRSIILHLQTHECPDLNAADDPNSWLDPVSSDDVRLSMIDRLASAHDALEAWFLATGDQEKFRDQRAELFAYRVMAHSTLDSRTDADTRQRTGFTEELVVQARDLIRTFLASVRGQGEHDARVPCLLAEAILSVQWEGDWSGFACRLRELANDRVLQPYERINLLRSALPTGDQDPEGTMDTIDQILDVADAQPPTLRGQLLASITPFLVATLTGVCRSEPQRASSISGRLGGFGADRSRWSSRPHVWLLSGREAIALIDRSDSVEVFGLPTLGERGTLEKLVNLHAEEHEQIHDLGRLRKQLTEQMRPLTARLSEFDVPVTIFGFGHLKYLPLGALTGSGAILATTPGVRGLARRQDWEVPSPECEIQRRLVIDDALVQSRSIPTAQGAVIHFNSAAPFVSEEEAVRPMESLIEPAREIVFFGHGFVDQFRSAHFGLVTRHDFVRGGAYFVPATFLSSGDLRCTTFALIMACGSGQGGVFSNTEISVADAFCIAGCQLVIAPLWPIEATVAADFTRKFLAGIDNGARAEDMWSQLLSQEPNRFCSIALFSD